MKSRETSRLFSIFLAVFFTMQTIANFGIIVLYAKLLRFLLTFY